MHLRSVPCCTGQAPLTGGYALLCQRRMTVLVGGDKKLLEDNQQLLENYTATVIHIGEAGQASLVKLITNQLAAVHTVVSSEAVMMVRLSCTMPVLLPDCEFRRFGMPAQKWPKLTVFTDDFRQNRVVLRLIPFSTQCVPRPGIRMFSRRRCR